MGRERGVLLWDFHGTLAYGGWEWAATFEEILHMYAPRIHLSHQDIHDALQEGFGWHSPDQDHVHVDNADAWWLEHQDAFTRGFRRMGVEDNVAEYLASLVRPTYLRPGRFRLFEDSLPTLRYFEAQRWRQAILSNHIPELPEILEDLGLLASFEQVFTSALAGYEKPRVELFQLALLEMGNPECVWMIGDDPVSDVGGAKSAGIPAILVRRKADVPFVARDLAAVIRIVNNQRALD